MRSVITGTGSCIPTEVVPNRHFLEHDFRSPSGTPISKANTEIVAQFESITGIRERRYVEEDRLASDLATDAARQALESCTLDPETLDYIVLGHNFGDVRKGSSAPDQIPALAARVKAKLRIRNPHTVALDLIFGCPGWLQGVIYADQLIRAGDARRVMVVGAETLSRVCDPHDRDSMIYADGAGAAIVERRDTDEPVGILAHAVRSDTLEHSGMLSVGPSYKEGAFAGGCFLKMEGRKLYKYALTTVAGAIKDVLDRAGVDIRDVAKILLHQANDKMDEAILGALYELYGISPPPAGVMPMTISWLGNSSVATLPTMLDLIRRQKLDPHRIAKGDLVVFASVGAGMHVNAIVYREA